MDIMPRDVCQDQVSLQTQLSLSKLALLAADSTHDHTHSEGIPEVAELNRQLEIVEYQHNIPDSVMEVGRERGRERERERVSEKDSWCESVER